MVTPPKLTKIRRRIEGESVADVGAAVDGQMHILEDRIARGGQIAIAVGSRGIANLPTVVRAIVEFVRGKGAEPFIVPAMGSHGGATAEGQREVLAGYGITEGGMGAPVRSSMEVVEIAGGESIVPLYMDRAAYGSDGVIVVNRVKPHTDFHGRYESGLVKMCVIGLGKREQAHEIHRRGVRGLRELIAPVAREILSTGRIIGGVALVENARDETMTVRAIKAEDILDEEPALLEAARENMARLPVRDIDVLVIDRIGKDISGVGIDPNVVGRMGIRGEPDADFSRIAAIVACDLTEASHGNALGVGLADVITRRLFERIDFEETYANVYASTFLDRAKVPVVAETAREALAFALRSAHTLDDGGSRIVRIVDTLHLEEMHVSAAVLEDLKGREDIEVEGEARDLFYEDGALTPF